MEFQFTHKFIINEQCEEVIQKNVPSFLMCFCSDRIIFTGLLVDI